MQKTHGGLYVYTHSSTDFTGDNYYLLPIAHAQVTRVTAYNIINARAWLEVEALHLAVYHLPLSPAREKIQEGRLQGALLGLSLNRRLYFLSLAADRLILCRKTVV